MTPNPSNDLRSGKGFTLVEMLVSLALLSVISVLLVSMTNSTASTWRYATAKIEQFSGATAGFEAITRRLSQATLNTYWDYDSPTAPKKYLRQSDLRFISGNTQTLVSKTSPRRPTHGIFFQAPLGFVDDTDKFGGLDNLLNTWGYYVEFNKDTRPDFINNLPTAPPLRYRYRLMELMQPSNGLSIYSYTSGKPLYTGKDWFSVPMASATPPAHVLAENVIALVLLPKFSKNEKNSGGSAYSEYALAPLYSYDSTTTNADAGLNPKNQLPPVVQVTLVAIDEASASRIAKGTTPPSFDSQLSTLFTNAQNYDADLKTLQTTLIASHIGYRVFTTNVSIRAAKWSRK